jgi:hypothetical protein
MPQNTQIQVRRDYASQWISVNPQLALGEIGLELDTGKFKIGTLNTQTTQPYYWNDEGFTYAGSNATITSLVTGQYGGTGVDNGNKKIILGGNLTTSGGNITLTANGTTSATLPPGISVLAKSDGSNLSANSLTSSSLSKYATSPYLWYCAAADKTDCTNGGNLFGLTNGVTVDASTTYEFQFNWLGYVAGSSINCSLAFASPTGSTVSFEGYSIFTSTATDVGQGTGSVGFFALGPTSRQTNTSVTLLPSATGTSKYVSINVRGMLITNASGNFSPTLNFTGASTIGTFTTYAGSYMSLRPFAASGTSYDGSWG